MAIRVLGIELVKKEVSHDQIIKVVLVCVVALIKNNQVDVRHIRKAVHQQVIKFLCHRYEDIVFVELLAPSFKFGVALATFLLSAEISSDDEISVSFDGCRLLLDQVLDGYDEKYLFALGL